MNELVVSKSILKNIYSLGGTKEQKMDIGLSNDELFYCLQLSPKHAEIRVRLTQIFMSHQ